MKVLITGGHFSPAYSVIQEFLKKKDEVVIVGRVHPLEGQKSAQSLEYRVSKDLNLQFIELSTGRLQRTLSLYSLFSLFKFLRGITQSFQILKNVQPDVVLTFGGYLALPVAIAARIKNIPVITHEQTQGIGLSNKIIAKFSSALCISFPSTQKYIQHKNSVLTGNPIRKEVFKVDEKIDHEKNIPVLYITGGSTGSHVLNTVVYGALEELVKRYVVIHQTGENDFKDYEKLAQKQNDLLPEYKNRYIVSKYIYPSQIGYIYQNSSLVITRSGANTVQELLATNTPAILIPLPHGQRGEQTQNARLIQSLGLGEIVLQKNLNSSSLVVKVDEMQKNIAKYTITKDIIDRYIFDNAASKIVDVVTAEYEKKKNNP
jgi:UDP-N-acetylglucosamine--N-acetylmuramyl-(pentapeptide) pyrophosphoryl-undecaprenol N-acetylglucosamine transferase